MMAMPNLACYKCIDGHPQNTINGIKTIAPCIGPPECVAHQFAGVTIPSQEMIDIICTGLCTDECSVTDMQVINEKRTFFNCPAPAPAPAADCTTPTTPTPTPAGPAPAPAAASAVSTGVVIGQTVAAMVLAVVHAW